MRRFAGLRTHSSAGLRTNDWRPEDLEPKGSTRTFRKSRYSHRYRKEQRDDQVIPQFTITVARLVFESLEARIEAPPPRTGFFAFSSAWLKQIAEAQAASDFLNA
jgi:hypothetical protein